MGILIADVHCPHTGERLTATYNPETRRLAMATVSGKLPEPTIVFISKLTAKPYPDVIYAKWALSAAGAEVEFHQRAA